MDKEKKKENLLLLGLLVKILIENHQGVGGSSVSLCVILIDNKKALGKSYAEANRNLLISMSTIHKVFHTLIRVGVLERDTSGTFLFNREKALKMAIHGGHDEEV